MEGFETTDKYTAYFFELWLSQMRQQMHTYHMISHYALVLWILIVGLAIDWVSTMSQGPYLVLFTVNKYHYGQQIALFWEFTCSSSLSPHSSPNKWVL